MGENYRQRRLKRLVYLKWVDQLNKQDVEHIQTVVAEFYGIDQRLLLRKDSSQKYSRPRQISHYLCKRLLSLSNAEIGKLHNGMDGSTVHYSVNKIKGQLKIYESLRKEVEQIENQIQNGKN